MSHCCVPSCKRHHDATKKPTLHLFPHPYKEPERHQRWIKAINSDKIFGKGDPILVYKQLRVCRNHFDKECFNGECKKLQKSAVPTLKLGNNSNNLSKSAIYDQVMVDNLKTNDVTICKDVFELISLESTERSADTNAEIDIDEESQDKHLIYNEDFDEANLKINYESGESYLYKVKQDDTIYYNLREESLDEEIFEEHLIEREDEEDQVEEAVETKLEEALESQLEEFLIPHTSKVQSIQTQTIKRKQAFQHYNKIKKQKIVNAESVRKPLSNAVLQTLRTDFYKCKKNRLAQNVCSRVDPFEAALSRGKIESTQHVFTYKIESEGKPITNQKSSGRCWNFATLNVIRIPFMKQHNIEEFEFSQAYLFYWDKIERSYYFLNNIVETAKRGESVDGRLNAFLMSDPTCDGGQWDMIVNLINKHGLMPKKCFPESFSCEASGRMNAILKSKLRQYAKEIRDLVAGGASDDNVQSTIDKQMKEIYNIVGICLGIPPATFTWEYYDKTKKYNVIEDIKPTEFYEKYVKPYFNVDDKVCLVTDPRPSSEYGKGYTVDCLGNVIGGRPVFYNNQPVELLMDLVVKSIKAGEAVWFGCEVSKRFNGKLGIEDLEIYDFDLLFGTDIEITMSKADRLIYGESLMTHAMAITGASVDKNDKPTKYRVENSWGEERGEKGYLVMTADWFKEFVFEAVVDKSHVPSEVLKVFDMKPIVLPAWDPMGCLAK